MLMHNTYHNSRLIRRLLQYRIYTNIEPHLAKEHLSLRLRRARNDLAATARPVNAHFAAAGRRRLRRKIQTPRIPATSNKQRNKTSDNAIYALRDLLICSRQDASFLQTHPFWIRPVHSLSSTAKH